MPAGFVDAEDAPELTPEQIEKKWLDDMRVMVAMTGGIDLTEK